MWRTAVYTSITVTAQRVVAHSVEQIAANTPPLCRNRQIQIEKAESRRRVSSFEFGTALNKHADSGADAASNRARSCCVSKVCCELNHIYVAQVASTTSKYLLKPQAARRRLIRFSTPRAPSGTICRERSGTGCQERRQRTVCRVAKAYASQDRWKTGQLPVVVL